jgi:hypothetical protein
MTEDGEYIYSVDHNGWIYVLSHTKSASRYVAYYHLWHTENRTQEALEEIQNNNPRYIVVNKNEEVFKELQEYISSNYNKELYGTSEYILWGRKQ